MTNIAFDKNSNKKIVAVFAGRFDPITLGHLEIIKKAAKITDILYVAIGDNFDKKPLINATKRIEIIKKTVANIPDVIIKVQKFDGLLVEYMKSIGTDIQFRGIRNNQDFSYEKQMLEVNQKLYPQINTYFIPATSQYAHISASFVRQIASMKGDLKPFLPPYAEQYMKSIE